MATPFVDEDVRLVRRLTVAPVQPECSRFDPSFITAIRRASSRRFAGLHPGDIAVLAVKYGFSTVFPYGHCHAHQS
jgi:hypothetical protein